MTSTYMTSTYMTSTYMTSIYSHDIESSVQLVTDIIICLSNYNVYRTIYGSTVEFIPRKPARKQYCYRLCYRIQNIGSLLYSMYICVCVCVCVCVSTSEVTSLYR